jgi:hypothetical protein
MYMDIEEYCIIARFIICNFNQILLRQTDEETSEMQKA